MSEAPETQPCPAQGDEDFALASMPGDPRLIAEGWVRRHLVDVARAQESIDLYRSTGYEVKVQELTPADFGPQCAHCASVMCHACVLIYTRKTEP
ncbi:MAG: hypothetical protein ACYS15_17120 [Planctomycetota bacterium]